MATYLIGIESKMLFEITDVKKISIQDEMDLVEIYNREKQLIFACNKIDMDFIAKWEEGLDIPKTIKKIYDVPSEETETPSEETEEPNPETTEPVEETQPTTEVPSKESQNPSEEPQETQPE